MYKFNLIVYTGRVFVDIFVEYGYDICRLAVCLDQGAA